MKQSLLFIIIIFMMSLSNNFYVAEVEGKEVVSTKIAINKKNFPDKTLRKMVREQFDTNEDIYLSTEEAEKVEKIKIDKEITFWGAAQKQKKESTILNCKGLQYFTNIKILIITVGPGIDDDNSGTGRGAIKNIEYIKNLKSLEKLKIYGDGTIDKFNLKKLKNLKSLEISSTDATKIIVNNNTKLDKLILRHNRFAKKLNISELKKLTKLSCKGAKFETIIFPENNNLKNVSLTATPIKEIKMEWFNPNTLETLRIANIELTELDVTGFNKLEFLFLWPEAEVIGANENLRIRKDMSI